MLHRRAQAARAHEDPRLPRRPARHRDHRRRRRSSTGSMLVGKDISKVKLRVSGAGAAALACLDLLVASGTATIENIFVSDIKGVVYKGRNEEMDPEKARYARETKARTLARSLPGADIFPGSLRWRRAEARDGQEHGRSTADPGARQPRTRDQAGARRAGFGRTAIIVHWPLRLSKPGQQRPVLPLHLSGRSRCRRHHDQRGDEARRGAGHRRVWRARKRPTSSPAPTVEQSLAFGRGLPDPKTLRPAAHRASRAGGGQGRDGQRRCDASASPISRPIANSLARFVYHSGNSMKPVFEAAKNAAQARRLCRGRGRARAARGASRGRRGPRPSGAARPCRRHRAAHQKPRAAAQARQDLRGA